MNLNSEKILVRGVNWLGDAIMTTPALARLREAKPEAKIVLLTPQKIADLWTAFPDVDQVMTFNDADSLWQIAARLRAENFTQAIILPNSPRSALECWWAKIPKRVGYLRPWRRWFLTQAIPDRPGIVKMKKRTPQEVRKAVKIHPLAKRESYPVSSHHLEDYLHLMSHTGASAEPLAPFLTVPPEEMDAFHAKFLRQSAAKVPSWVGLNAGAEYGPAKRWPEERFVQAAAEIHQRTGTGFLVFGGKADQTLAGSVAHQIHLAAPTATILNVAGKTSLRELCVGLKLCQVVLTNDTGPMHVATAVGTPVVVPFGSTSPELTGPGLPGDSQHALVLGQAPCAPCFLRECPIDFRCMNNISAAHVAELVVRILQRAQPGMHEPFP